MRDVIASAATATKKKRRRKAIKDQTQRKDGQAPPGLVLSRSSAGWLLLCLAPPLLYGAPYRLQREFGPAASQVRGASLVRQTSHPPPSTRLVQTRLDSASASRSLVEAPRIQAWQLFLGGGESVYICTRETES